MGKKKAGSGNVGEAMDRREKQIKTNAKAKGLDHRAGHILAREQVIARIQKFTLFSDAFMSVALEDRKACQYVLRILTGNSGLKLRAVKSQYRISQVASHDAQLDVIAEGEDGTLYALEIQQRDIVDHPRRVRFYEALIDSSFLQKGCSYDEMPEVRLFYIGAKDFQKSRMTEWEVEKRRSKTHEQYEDGLHTTYVNAEIDDRSEVARLMKYFKTADPEDMSAGELSKRVHFLKRTKRGQTKMCEVTDWFWMKGYESGERRGERRGIRRGRDSAVFSYIRANVAEGRTEEQISQALQKYFVLKPEQAREYVKKFSSWSLS